MPAIHVRLATPDDWEVVADFNCRLAIETESKRLDADTVCLGVQRILADATKGRYFLACVEGRPIGQMAHTLEWSDWRNGEIWWLQSVYIQSEFRGQGVFRALFNHLHHEAETDPNVVGLRLYVEDNNKPAQDVYRHLGLKEGGYFVMERFLKRGE